MGFLYNRLQYFLGVIVILSIVVPAVITGFLVVHKNFSQSVEFQSKIRAKNYLEVLQGGLSLAMWNLSPELANPILDSIKLDENVLAIEVKHPNGVIFGQYYRWPVEIIERENNKIMMDGEVRHQGSIIGQVQLTYGLRNSIERAKEDAISMAKLLFIQVFVTFLVLSLFLNIRVMKPLKKLRDAAKRIANNDLKTKVAIASKDEFGELSEQLESMRSALQKNIELLEFRVVQRTREQEKLNSQLHESVEQLQQAQTQLVQQEKLAALGGLVAGVAHELNTPVGNALTVATSLSASTEIIKEKLASGMTKTAFQQYIADVDEGSSMIEQNLTRAAELVAGFKQTAIDQTTAKRRQFDLQQLINETILTITPNLRNKNIRIYTDIPPGIVMDSYPGPLSQIITNLINNAVLHAYDEDESGLVIIFSENYEYQGQPYVRINFKDDGRGIPPENQKKIFDPFFTTKLGKGGNGLGMHIVHNLVTGALGGDVHLESELGIGTEFIFRLPKAAPVLQHVDGNI